MARVKNPIAPIVETIPFESTPNEKTSTPIQEKEPDSETTESETYIPTSKKNIDQSNSKYGHLNFPEGLFTINNTSVVLAKSGASLLAIAHQYNISLSKLLLYNDMNEVDILKEDQLIYLERKQKKGENDFHIVKKGETLNEISQLTGVRLESILLYNKWSKSTLPIPGSKVYLKSLIENKTTPNKK